jgi:hypothetical protein
MLSMGGLQRQEAYDQFAEHMKRSSSILQSELHPRLPHFIRLITPAIAVSLFALIASEVVDAAPYASKVRVTGTTVTFILNEPADVLRYRLNNGPAVALDGSTKGTKSFLLNAPSDNFEIIAGKNTSAGYTIPTGGTIASAATGLSVASAASGFNPISDDSNPLDRFNSPRGVSVSVNPGATNFGTVYIANSAAGTTTGVIRTLGDGLYAMNSDQTDAFGYGDSAQDPGNSFDTLGASANSPFKLYAATNGEVYVADFSDANSDVYRENFNLTAPPDGVQVFSVVGGPTTLPPGQTHGSPMAVYTEGSLAGGDLTVYTTDEDLRTSPTGTDDRGSLWQYPINAGPLPSAVAPTRVNQAVLMVPLAAVDLQRGRDGKWYAAQNRAAGNEAGLFVLDANGATLFDSLSASRTLLGNPTAPDILRNIQGMSVSEDQKWLALMLNNSDVAVLPLVNGLPDIANRLVVDTGTDVNSGRDISFDAAGNIHYVSSGQALYRVLSPGGISWAITALNGGSASFTLRHVPDLDISSVGGQIKLEWIGGVLQESTSLSGPWSDSATQTSPYMFTPDPSDPPKYFRLRGL